MLLHSKNIEDMYQKLKQPLTLLCQNITMQSVVMLTYILVSVKENGKLTVV